MDLRKLIQEYLIQTHMLHLATLHDNQPWSATVYFANDVDFNLYWLSSANTRHSNYIEKNSKVSGTIVLPHTYGDKIRGLQIQGTARKLKDAEEEQGFNVFKSKFWVVEQPGDTHSCYQLKPTSIFLNDEVNFPQSPMQELQL